MKQFYFAKRKLPVMPAIILVALAISIPLSAQTITSFDAPDAGTGSLQGTFVTSPLIINPDGVIAGWAVDSAFVYHGFLRDKNGVITTFDAPGAGTGAGQGTLSFAISPRGEITGFYFDGTNAVRGFLRDEEGVITTFDVPV